MLKQRIELNARAAIERALEGAQSEDSFVEFKTQWPVDHGKAARQIAALCNAARGSEAMWVVGVDEKGRHVKGALAEELSSWWPRVESHFDGVAPGLTTVAFDWAPGRTIVVLSLQTDNAPYVFVTKKEPYSREIPWRSGERTRSARRGEVLELLVPKLDMPGWEFVSARATLSQHSPTLRFEGDLYLETNQPLSLPHHRCHSYATYGLDSETVDLAFSFRTNTRDVRAVERVVRVAEPAVLHVSADADVELDAFQDLWDLHWHLVLGLGLSGDSISTSVRLTTDAVPPNQFTRRVWSALKP